MFTQACQTLNMDTFLKCPCERQDHSLRALLFFFHAPHTPRGAYNVPEARVTRGVMRWNPIPIGLRPPEVKLQQHTRRVSPDQLLAAHTSVHPKALTPNALLTGTQTSRSAHGRGDPTAHVGKGKRRWRIRCCDSNCRLRPLG